MQAPTFIKALEQGRATREQFDGLDYLRLEDATEGYPRGSVLLPDGRVLPGYPSIGRIQWLHTGLRRHFTAPFWAEEKIDGYNVRIVRHEGQSLAITRGGFVCPFSTDRLDDLLPPDLLRDEPGLMLCAEIAGPDNPYLEGHPPHVAEDVALFVFDMMRAGQDGFLPQVEKMDRLRRYGIPATRIFGRYMPDEPERLARLAIELDAEGAEGMVLKAEDSDYRSKYVTGRSNIIDIGVCSEQLLDLPPEYFTNRLLRLALFAVEHGGADDAALQRSLGEAFLGGLQGAIERGRRQGRVGHRFRCRFRRRTAADAFMRHLQATGGRRIHLERSMPREQEGYWVLEFERVLDRMTGTLSQVLSGGSQFD